MLFSGNFTEILEDLQKEMSGISEVTFGRSRTFLLTVLFEGPVV